MKDKEIGYNTTCNHSKEWWLKQAEKEYISPEYREYCLDMASCRPLFVDMQRETRRKIHQQRVEKGYYQEYYQANKERIKANSKAHYTGNTNQTYNHKAKAQCVLDAGRCEICGDTDNLLGHHIIPIGYEGSTDEQDNLMCLCSSCHQSLHSYIRDCDSVQEILRVTMEVLKGIKPTIKIKARNK